MPREQIIFDLMDMVINFNSVIEMDDFAVYIYSIYAHNRYFRYVRMFEGIFDKDILRAFLSKNSLDINNINTVVEAIYWEYSLWVTGIKVRKSRAEYLPRISPVVNNYLKQLSVSGREILNATLRYIHSVDPSEFRKEPIVEEIGSDLSTDTSTKSKSSTNSTGSSISSTGLGKQHSVTLAQVKQMLDSHIPDAKIRLERIQARDEMITRKIAEEEDKKLKRAEKEKLRIEKEGTRLEDKLAKEAKKKQKAEEQAQKEADKQTARELKLAIQQAKREQLELLQAQNEQLRQDTKIKCACGEYYTKSNKVHHQKKNKIHIEFALQNAGIEF
jgi:hypothetical protein